MTKNLEYKDYKIGIFKTRGSSYENAVDIYIEPTNKEVRII